MKTWLTERQTVKEKPKFADDPAVSMDLKDRMNGFTKTFLQSHAAGGIKSVCCFSKLSNGNVFLKNTQHVSRLCHTKFIHS